MRYKQVRREEAEKIITEYLGSIFGFALKRCRNAQDAEDLSQDIVFRAFRALLIKDDIVTLLNDGKLKPPTEGQKKALREFLCVIFP